MNTMLSTSKASRFSCSIVPIADVSSSMYMTHRFDSFAQFDPNYNRFAALLLLSCATSEEEI